MESVDDLMLIGQPRKDHHYTTILCLQKQYNLPMEMIRMIIDEVGNDQRIHAKKWKKVHEEFEKLDCYEDMVCHYNCSSENEFYLRSRSDVFHLLEDSLENKWIASIYHSYGISGMSMSDYRNAYLSYPGDKIIGFNSSLLFCFRRLKVIRKGLPKRKFFSLINRFEKNHGDLIYKGWKSRVDSSKVHETRGWLTTLWRRIMIF